jgi:aldose 1-epimerase
MNKRLFGNTGDTEIYLYTLTSDCAVAEVMTRGATLVSFRPFGVDIVGGFDTLEGYLADDSHQGGIIGRVANRVADATFTMDGAVYMLPDNDNGNCLHGGCGFDYRVWTVESAKENSITLSYYSPDGEEGFPSGLAVEVTYTLDGATLMISYKATPDGKTPVALTNHAYFNLDGFDGTVKEQTIQIYADSYTEVDDMLIPNGNRPAVEGTPFDLREPHKIGERFSNSFDGYDHNFMLCPNIFKEFNNYSLGLAAVVESDNLKMSVYTDQPGIQFYTANFLKQMAPEHIFHGGITPIKHGAICLEAQTEPNCINHGIGFYDAGEVYTQTTVYQVEKK